MTAPLTPAEIAAMVADADGAPETYERHRESKKHVRALAAEVERLRGMCSVFAEAWVKWIGNPESMPDEETIEAAWSIVHYVEAADPTQT